jgi:hypothetical protein
MTTTANLRVTQRRENGFNKKICWSVRLCCWGKSSWCFESSALSLDCLTLIMKARQSAETSGTTRRQIRHIPARLNLKPPGGSFNIHCMTVIGLTAIGRGTSGYRGRTYAHPLITVFINFQSLAVFSRTTRFNIKKLYMVLALS